LVLHHSLLSPPPLYDTLVFLSGVFVAPPFESGPSLYFVTDNFKPAALVFWSLDLHSERVDFSFSTFFSKFPPQVPRHDGFPPCIDRPSSFLRSLTILVTSPPPPRLSVTFSTFPFHFCGFLAFLPVSFSLLDELQLVGSGICFFFPLI